MIYCIERACLGPAGRTWRDLFIRMSVCGGRERHIRPRRRFFGGLLWCNSGFPAHYMILLLWAVSPTVSLGLRRPPSSTERLVWRSPPPHPGRVETSHACALRDELIPRHVLPAGLEEALPLDPSSASSRAYTAVACERAG